MNAFLRGHRVLTVRIVDWLDLSTNTATSGFLDLLDPDAGSYPYRFYRGEVVGP